MGVPRLFKWIAENYPQYIKTISRSRRELTQVIDNFYIDSNPILHYACQKIFNYGQYKRMLDPNSGLSKQDKILKSYELYFSTLKQLIYVVNPKKLIYIAIDGCAPAGKMVQQRQRRFMSAIGRDPSSGDAFDSNCLSPGTEYMDGLRQYVNYKILEEYSNDERTIIFSPANVVGEGEQKIMEYIRKNTPQALPYRVPEALCVPPTPVATAAATHSGSPPAPKATPSESPPTECMYGPDGDLIMLTLVSPSTRFFLIRDDMINVEKYDFVDIGKLRIEIAKYFGCQTTHINDIYRHIHDFILMGFFVGNDFLPKIQMFYYLEHGMELMARIYIETRREFSFRRFLIHQGKIDVPMFSKFIEKLQHREMSLLRSQCVTAHEVKTDASGVKTLQYKGEEKYKNNTLFKCCKMQRDSVFLDYSKYRTEYNQAKPNSIQEYLNGLYWVYVYYTSGCSSYKWFYPCYYAPLMIDIKEFLDKAKGASLPSGVFALPTSNEMHSQYQQLLSILPISSKKLLPTHLAKLFEPNSPIIEYYPKQFEVDYEGKYQEHQGIALLPIVDPDIIRGAYNSMSVGMTDKDPRNKQTTPFKFNKSGVATSKTYKTKYGPVTTNLGFSHIK